MPEFADIFLVDDASFGEIHPTNDINFVMYDLPQNSWDVQGRN